MSKRRVVITGLGIVSPVGNDVATAWKNIVEGKSGIGPVTHFDASTFPTRIAGEVRPASVNRALPINFVGGPDTVVAQIRRCREQTGAGVIDLGFQTPGSTDPGAHQSVLEMFGRTVLPHVRDF